MTSLYIPPEKKLLVNDILRSYPTVQVIELDKIIDRIRTIVSQVTQGLEVMTLLILGCGVLVMFAAVSLSMSERLQESAILRTLGSSRQLILGIQLIEFSALGTMAGLLASAGAELSVAMLQRYMFDLPFSMHLWRMVYRAASWRYPGWLIRCRLQSEGCSSATPRSTKKSITNRSTRVILVVTEY